MPGNNLEKPIIVQNLSKNFGDFVAVDKVSFEIDQGEIFGFLGPNGSGKSTTIKMLTGLLVPTSGTAFVAGYDVSQSQEGVRKNIGYMSQKFSLYQSLTALENLHFYADIYEIPIREMKQHISETVDRLYLKEYLHRLARDLPVGVKQRLALGVSYLHKPDILFLDEPTAGVDPSQRRIFWDWIYGLSDSGVAIFVTTHYMDEVEHCNRVGLISDGKIIAIGTPTSLKIQVAKGIPVKLQSQSGTVFSPPGDFIDKNHLSFDKGEFSVILPDEDAFVRLRESVEKQGFPLRVIRELPSMEEAFITLMDGGNVH